MPLYRRIPKRGFTNRNTKKSLQQRRCINRFDDGATVTVDSLIESGIITNPKDGIKILGNGELTKKLDVKVNAFSASAIEKFRLLVEMLGDLICLKHSKRYKG